MCSIIKKQYVLWIKIKIKIWIIIQYLSCDRGKLLRNSIRYTFALIKTLCEKCELAFVMIPKK